MKIKRVYNNNVALTEGHKQTELVVMGRGLAFQKKIGDFIDTEKIEKTFIISSENFASKLSELLNEIPYEIMILSQDIIDLSNKELNTTLNESLYLSLADHIHFAITRLKEGIVVKNALMWEVKKFYKAECHVAQKALDLIHRRLDVRLPEEEVASIALHLFNARQDNTGMEETTIMTNIVTDITNIVKYHYGIEFDEESMNYNRLITHLRYFAYRMLRGELNNDDFDVLFEQVRSQYPGAYECVKKVQAYLRKQYEIEMSNDEMTYFMIHIQRVTSRETKK